MTSSKGNCGVSGGQFACGSGVSLTSFSAVSLTYFDVVPIPNQFPKILHRSLPEVTSFWRPEGQLHLAVMVSQVARQFTLFSLAVVMLMATHFQLLHLSIDPSVLPIFFSHPVFLSADLSNFCCFVSYLVEPVSEFHEGIMLV